MRTRSPISTISYNTPAFLCTKLEELRKAKILTRWYAIPHSPEDDEEKHHVHVYIEPAKQLFTDDLQSEFLEPDIKHPKRRPLGVLPFQASKLADWYLYGLHDLSYLKSKGETRKYHYTREDFLVFDLQTFKEDVRSITRTQYSLQERLLSMAQQHATFQEVIRQGLIHPDKFISQRAYYEALLEACTTNRNGRSNHEAVVQYDRDTGEVIKDSVVAVPEDLHSELPFSLFKHDCEAHYHLTATCPEFYVVVLLEKEKAEFEEDEN